MINLTSSRRSLIIKAFFIVCEISLYYLILTTSGDTLVWASYISIIICFLYSLSCFNGGDRFIILGLFFTAIADYFLVICSPINRFTGMLFFMGAQTLYAAKLYNKSKNKNFLIFRIAISIIALSSTFLILMENTDVLSLISIYYYANLIFNIAESIIRFKENKLFTAGLILLLLCDTIIGLQVADSSYLTIKESSIIYKIIYMDFHLSWFFYLPSQVLLALSVKSSGTKKDRLFNRVGGGD